MKSFVIAMMLLAFLMGLAYTTPGYLSKKYAQHPWEDFKTSQDKCEADPWERAT